MPVGEPLRQLRFSRTAHFIRVLYTSGTVCFPGAKGFTDTSLRRSRSTTQILKGRKRLRPNITAVLCAATDPAVDWKAIEEEQRRIYVSDPKHAIGRVKTLAERYGLEVQGGLLVFPAEALYYQAGDSVRPFNIYKGCTLFPESDFIPESLSNLGDTMDELCSPEDCPKDSNKLSRLVLNPSARTVEECSAGESALLRDFDFDRWAGLCPLFRDLSEGRALDLAEMTGLLRSLLLIRGGRRHFRELMQQRQQWSEHESEWNYEIRKATTYGVGEDCCNTFCRYTQQGQCMHQLTPLQQMPLRQGEIRGVEVGRQALSLRTAECELAAKWNRAQCSRGGIHLIKAPVGLGKTRLYLEERNAIIALPNHDRVREVAGAMRDLGNDILVIPELPEVNNDADTNPPLFDQRLREIYAAGAHELANRLIRKEAGRIGSNTPPDQRSAGQQALVDYCAAIEQLKTTTKTVLVTHKRLPFLPETPHDTIIIDEDILPTLLEVGTLSMCQLTSLSIPKNVSDFIASSQHDTWAQMPASLCEMTERLVDEVLDSRNSENVLRFLRADGFVKTVVHHPNGSPDYELRFGKKLGLPTGKRIIVLSATLNEKLYELAFPDRSVILHEVGAVEQQGRVVQFVDRAFSRSSLERLTASAEGDLRKIQMLVQDRRTITFQGYKKTLINLGFNVVEELHFGKCTSTQLHKST